MFKFRCMIYKLFQLGDAEYNKCTVEWIPVMLRGCNVRKCCPIVLQKLVNNIKIINTWPRL